MKVLYFNESIIQKKLFLETIKAENFMGRIDNKTHILFEVELRPGQVLIIKEWDDVIVIGADTNIYEKTKAPGSYL